MLTGNATQEAALLYAALGWRVVPIKPGKKSPSIDDWPNTATTDASLIRDWWSRWPDHGIGIVTGETSGIFVLDVDVSEGKHGDETLADLEATYGTLPTTVEAITGSGGRHLFFRWPGVEISNSVSRLGPGLDIRGTSGQVLAYPTIHPNGNGYAWDLLNDPRDGVMPADAPSWLVDLLTKPTDEQPRRPKLPTNGTRRPGQKFSDETPWAQLLEEDGATFAGSRRNHRDGSTYELWTRPGKKADAGASASLYYGGYDNLKVFTDGWPGLEQNKTYTKFGFLTAVRYRGDFRASTAALGASQSVVEVPDGTLVARNGDRPSDGHTEANAGIFDHLPQPVDWQEFWENDRTPSFLIEPLLPRGLQITLYAPAKEGKSLLALECAAAAATGKAVLGSPVMEPMSVVYMDHEMTETDLAERLSDMGYSEDDDLSNLHYYLLPAMPPLDTQAGGQVLEQIMERHQPDLLVVDTIARVVEGIEDKSDTSIALSVHTAKMLKRRGITVLWLDHAGKDITKGQRGSSAKRDFVDLVWQLTKVNDKGDFLLKATHRRQGWIPASVKMTRLLEPWVTHLLEAQPSTPTSQGLTMTEWECAKDLTDLGMASDCSVREAMHALRTAGKGRKQEAVRRVVKWRREGGTHPGHTKFASYVGHTSDTPTEKGPENVP